MSNEKCTSNEWTATQLLKRMRRLFIYIWHSIKSKVPLSNASWFQLLKCVQGGGDGHLELMKYGKFSTQIKWKKKKKQDLELCMHSILQIYILKKETQFTLYKYLCMTPMHSSLEWYTGGLWGGTGWQRDKGERETFNFILFVILGFLSWDCVTYSKYKCKKCF